MSPVAFLKDLLSRGMPLDMAIEAAEAFEAQVVLSASELIDTRRRKDRERKRAAKAVPRNSAESVETEERTETPSLPSSPQTPQQPTHPRGVSITRARGADFETFWQAYPAKIGKKAAEAAWAKAKDRPPLDDVLAAIDAYRRAKPPDRDWCHPSTWLNQGRWADEAPAPTHRTGIPRNERPDKLTAKHDNLERGFRAAERAADFVAANRTF